MADPIKRLNYFNGQFLKADDFNDEQSYHLAQLRRHNQGLHTWGVATGLTLSARAGDKQVTVAAGMAIDASGREIVLPDPVQTADLSTHSGKTVFVTVRYDEIASDQTSDTGVTGNTRTTELAVVEVSETPPADASQTLILGTAAVAGDGTVSGTAAGTDPNRRRPAGVVGGDLGVLSVTLQDPGRAPNQWTSLALGDANTAAFPQNVSIAGNLTAPGAITAGTINGRNPTADGQTLDQLVAGQPGLLPLSGGTITGTLKVNGEFDMTAGAIRPTSGNTATSGISFADNPGGGAADTAWIRYYARSGEACTLELGTLNDADDDIALMPSGNVGIKTNAPAYPLDVVGRMRVRQPSNSAPTAGVWFSGYNQNEFDAAFCGMQSANLVGFWGNVGTPNWRLSCNITTGDLTITGNGFKPGGGAWAATSDARLKQNVQPLEDALDRLMQLRAVTFEWISPEKHGNMTGQQTGFIAQEVEKVFPEWVVTDADGYRGVAIRGFEALAVEAMRELRAENEQLRARLEALEAAVAALAPREPVG